MRRTHTVFAALLVLSGIVIGGCKPADAPATTMTATGMPETMPAGATAPAAKDLTHELTVDQPFYLKEPGASLTSAGTLKTGSRVLVLIPGAMYSQVITETGITAFTLTDGLKPLGK